MKYYRGQFRPKHPEKYRGNPTNITYRSGWELRVMNYLDSHPNVIQWASEELVIPYVSPLDGRVHRYFPDFWIKMRDKDSNIVVTVVEVKPNKQTKPPEVKTRKTKKYITEVATYALNMSKWEAAKQYCADRKWKFLVVTEKELGIG